MMTEYQFAHFDVSNANRGTEWNESFGNEIRTFYLRESYVVVKVFLPEFCQNAYYEFTRECIKINEQCVARFNRAIAPQMLTGAVKTFGLAHLSYAWSARKILETPIKHLHASINADWICSFESYIVQAQENLIKKEISEVPHIKTPETVCRCYIVLSDFYDGNITICDVNSDRFVSFRPPAGCVLFYDAARWKCKINKPKIRLEKGGEKNKNVKISDKLFFVLPTTFQTCATQTRKHVTQRRKYAALRKSIKWSPLAPRQDYFFISIPSAYEIQFLSQLTYLAPEHIDFVHDYKYWFDTDPGIRRLVNGGNVSTSRQKRKRELE